MVCKQMKTKTKDKTFIFIASYYLDFLNLQTQIITGARSIRDTEKSPQKQKSQLFFQLAGPFGLVVLFGPFRVVLLEKSC